ncbi:MAG: UPF0158 family protein [Planctomycetota bacterium]
MKKLPVDIGEITELMDMHDTESEAYLDTHTGDTVLLPPEMVDLEDDDDLGDLPDWEKELIPIARAINADSERYVPLPESDPREDYQLMVKFAESLNDPGLRNQMSIALDGPGAFRRFRRVLESYPREQERWYTFKDEALAERVQEWLHEIGIEPIEKRAELP